MLTRYFIYGLLGWCLEIFWTGLGSLWSGNINLRGRTSLWMLPIYGLGILLEPIYEYFREQNLILRGIMYTLTIFAVEYFTGSFLHSLGIYAWDYRGATLAVNGVIRLDYAPVWFVVGLIFEKVYLFLKKIRLS